MVYWLTCSSLLASYGYMETAIDCSMSNEQFQENVSFGVKKTPNAQVQVQKQLSVCFSKKPQKINCQVNFATLEFLGLQFKISFTYKAERPSKNFMVGNKTVQEFMDLTKQ